MYYCDDSSYIENMIRVFLFFKEAIRMIEIAYLKNKIYTDVEEIITE